MRRSLLESAGIVLFTTCFCCAQAAFQASLYDERFALIALAASGLGVAGGLAVTTTAVAWAAVINANTWLAASGVAMAATLAVALFTPFGTLLAYLTLSLASAASTALATLAVATRCRVATSPAFLRALTLSSSVLLAVATTPALVSRFGGPLLVGALTAGGLCLIAFAIGTGKPAKVAGGTVVLLVLITLQAPGNYASPPRWGGGDAALTKPIYQEARGGPAHLLSTRWDGFERTDVVSYPHIHKDLLWLFTNGLPTGLLAADAPGNADDRWRRRQFPLTTLALGAGKAADLLVVAPAGGLEIRMALAAGIPHVHVIEEHRGMASLLEKAKGEYGGLIGPRRAVLTTTGVRRTLREVSRPYDEILLTVPQDRSVGWDAPRMADNYLYTREAFIEYWEHLKPGGLLVLLTGSEVSFVRALLTTWEVTLPGNGSSIADHAWGIELASLTPQLTPYHYLLMVGKDMVEQRLQSRVELALGGIRDYGPSKGIAISPLFGPGIEAKRHYQALRHPDGLAAARTVMGRAVSWKMQRLADLSVATDHRPFFFQAERDLHPFLKGLLGGILVVQAGVLLLPLGKERRLDHADTGSRPPLPALLGYFAATTLGVVLTAALLTCHAAPLVGRLDRSWAVVLVGLFVGAGAGRWHASGDGPVGHPWAWLGASAALSAGLTGGLLLATPQVAATWPWPLCLAAPAAAALPTGYLFALLLAREVDDLSRTLRSLLPWAWLTVGLSLVNGTIAALWTAQSRGWPAVWLAAAGAMATALAIAAWANAVAPEPPITAAGYPAPQLSLRDA
jgi:hypothetical protein